MSEVQCVVQCIWAVGAELGEGPVWSAGEQALWFVDIKGRRIHRYDARSGEGRSWDAPAPPGFLAPVEGGGWLAGLKTGLHRFDPADGRFTPYAAVEPHRPGNRLNDGCVDREGRLWFGSMHDDETDATGALYRLHGPDLVHAHDEGYVITNGPAFSPDGRVLYHTDTLERVIYAFDVDGEGRLGPRREFVRIAREGAYPDGPAVDAQGCVWTGLFGGWGVERYSPEGALIDRIELPCANVTKPAFGGRDLRTLYVTTAWKGLSAEARAAQPLAGHLFAVPVDTPGLPQVAVRL